jgi:hypothetical protein
VKAETNPVLSNWFLWGDPVRNSSEDWCTLVENQNGGSWSDAVAKTKNRHHAWCSLRQIENQQRENKIGIGRLVCLTAGGKGENACAACSCGLENSLGPDLAAHSIPAEENKKKRANQRMDARAAEDFRWVLVTESKRTNGTLKKKTGTAGAGLERFVRASRRTTQAGACSSMEELRETKKAKRTCWSKNSRGKYSRRIKTETEI